MSIFEIIGIIGIQPIVFFVIDLRILVYFVALTFSRPWQKNQLWRSSRVAVSKLTKIVERGNRDV